MRSELAEARSRLRSCDKTIELRSCVATMHPDGGGCRYRYDKTIVLAAEMRNRARHLRRGAEALHAQASEHRIA
jgi:hypothetical protein